MAVAAATAACFVYENALGKSLTQRKTITNTESAYKQGMCYRPDGKLGIYYQLANLSC